MNYVLVVSIALSITGWATVILYDKKIKEQKHDLYSKNTEIMLLYEAIHQMKINGGERVIYRDRPRDIPKGTIDAVKLAMKVSHPDNGGNNADFIKYNEVYKKLTGKRR